MGERGGGVISGSIFLKSSYVLVYSIGYLSTFVVLSPRTFL